MTRLGMAWRAVPHDLRDAVALMGMGALYAAALISVVVVVVTLAL